MVEVGIMRVRLLILEVSGVVDCGLCGGLWGIRDLFWDDDPV